MFVENDLMSFNNILFFSYNIITMLHNPFCRQLFHLKRTLILRNDSVSHSYLNNIVLSQLIVDIINMLAPWGWGDLFHGAASCLQQSCWFLSCGFNETSLLLVSHTVHTHTITAKGKTNLGLNKTLKTRRILIL